MTGDDLHAECECHDLGVPACDCGPNTPTCASDCRGRHCSRVCICLVHRTGRTPEFEYAVEHTDYEGRWIPLAEHESGDAEPREAAAHWDRHGCCSWCLVPHQGEHRVMRRVVGPWEPAPEPEAMGQRVEVGRG